MLALISDRVGVAHGAFPWGEQSLDHTHTQNVPNCIHVRQFQGIIATPTPLLSLPCMIMEVFCFYITSLTVLNWFKDF